MSEVTVLVPCYNHALFIERCLRSIFAQTYQPKKLIVINDGSSDKSPEIIKETLKDCPFPSEFISRENRGLCATLNEGFSLVDTEYFAYVSSDDAWLPELLEKRVETIKNNPDAVLVFGHAYLIDNDDHILDCTANWEKLPSGNMKEKLLTGSHYLNVLYRTKFLRKHEWNEDAKLEDYEMHLRLITEGDFVRDDNVLCAWRMHETNASKNWSENFQEVINSQNRCRTLLGLSEPKLQEFQKKLKLNSIDQFIRTGNKRQAFSILRENFGSTESYKQIADLFFRLLTPQTLLQWNRERKKKNTIKNLGKLKY